MRSRDRQLPWLLVSAALAACEPESGEPDHPNLTGSAAAVVGISGLDAATGSAAWASAPTHLPCDIEALLKARCNSCHSPSTQPHRPVSLISQADLSQPSKSMPGLSYAQQAEQLVRSGMMPPTGALNATDIDAFSRWVRAGAQPAECGAGLPGGSINITPLDAGGLALDAGALDASPTHAADARSETAHDAAGADADAYATPTHCTSGSRWSGGEMRSPQMHPGRACVACHTAGAGFLNLQHGPSFSLAGTVFPSAHEPDDCNGADPSGISIAIKGADGRTTTLMPNAAGNFYSSARISLPYTVEIHYQGRVRAMQQPQTVGDCNSCHTEQGASGAPGRIMLP